MEPAVARLAAGKVNAQRLVDADAQWSRSYRSAVVSREDANILANKEFHLVVAGATGDKQLVRRLERVLDETDRLIYLGLPIAGELSEIQEGHKPLIDVLLHGSPADAKRAAEEHVEVAKTIVVDAVVATESIHGAEIVAH